METLFMKTYTDEKSSVYTYSPDNEEKIVEVVHVGAKIGTVVGGVLNNIQKY